MSDGGTSSVLEYPSEGDDGADFLRRRVAIAGVVMGDAFLVFLVFRAVMLAVAGLYDQFLHPAFVLHALTALIFFSMWLVLRPRGLSVQAVRTVETAGLVLGSSATVLMGTYIPLEARPDFIILAAMMLLFFARSIWVPSSARRTALLGLAIGLPMVVAMHFRYLSFDVSVLRAVLGDDMIPSFEMTSDNVAFGVSASLSVWWVLTVAIAASASKVFYELRQQVRDAKQLGQYKLERKLGEGGMGIVFRATHGMLRRPTAVKLLLPEKAGEHNLQRFEREVQLTATLTHPNTVTVFDYGRTPDGILYYAMELLDGATLEAIVELQLPIPEPRVIRILEQAAGALAEAHGRGLVHRDIKPSNIMLCHYGGRYDTVKVLDFGLIKQLGTDGETGLTQAESLTGTPQYMSPEAITDPDSVDSRSDVYSFGCVAYYILTGRNVFEAKSVVEVCGHHLHSTPQRPSGISGRAITPALEHLVMSCLAKLPDERPADGHTLLSTLQRIALEADGEWRDHDAEEWWDEYGNVLMENHAGESVDSALRTIDVDFERRRAAQGSKSQALL